MLMQIHIQDLLTIEELHLDLCTGLTMITGETGAGKSVFIEAIELALGRRTSQDVIRPGKDKAEISLSFDVAQFPHVIDRLKKSALWQDNSICIIRRLIMQDGRTSCTVNGNKVTVQWLKELGELLFHLHSQHEQHVLLKPDKQREILDRYGALLSLALDVKTLAENWRSLDSQVTTLREKMIERRERSDYLHFQLDEINAIGLLPFEWEKLEAQHQKLSHAEDLNQHIEEAIFKLANEDNQTVLASIRAVRKNLENIASFDSKVETWLTLIDSSFIQLKDLTSELKHYVNEIEHDPHKLKRIEERMGQIFNLARKHKIKPQELLSFKENLEQELALLKSSDESLIQLENEKLVIEKSYRELADELSSARQKAALQLEKEITHTMKSLSLPHGEFRVALEKYSINEHPELSPYGNEKIIFTLKTNPDQHHKPLAKAISGGELSRLSLAAHLALTHRITIPTLVFDEVDTGLSGATAEKIGKLLRKLGGFYQVFCVTHQPQVAACGNHHLLVEKYFAGSCTYTRLHALNIEEKTKEIARLLGGEKITERTLAHAREVLQSV